MENNVKNNTQYDHEIDLKELFDVLLAGSRKIIAITAVFAIASVIYALSIPNQYKATVLLAPAQTDNSSLSGTMGQLGGLASFAGISIGGGEASEFKIAQEIMKSWSFIESFIEENDLAVQLSAIEGWDIEANELKINDSVYDIDNKRWLVEKPSSWKLFTSFSEIVSIGEPGISGLLPISIEHYSPHVAKQWLDLYISAINKHMQERQMVKISNNIEYIETQIEKTSITEMQKVFYTIIEEQIKNKMLAEASPDYVFVAVSPSMVPEERSHPKRTVIVIIGTLFGGILSVLLVLLMHYFRRSN